MDAPEWFTWAVGQDAETASVRVAGCDIAMRMWGPVDAAGIVLIHGGAAHSHWWSHIAPHLSGYRIVALDLSGHGDSGRRDGYTVDRWTEEVLAVAEHAISAGPPVIIGHSMGGFVTAATAVRARNELAGIIILDSPMVTEDPEVEAARIGGAFGQPKTYADRATAMTRFRTVPRQPNYLDYVVDHVAFHSLTQRADDARWEWKFDPGIFRAVNRSAAAEMLPSISCRVGLLRAQHGLVTEDIAQIMYQRLGRVAPVVEIPEAGHHLMLDQPLLVITALRALLADWEHSVPRLR